MCGQFGKPVDDAADGLGVNARARERNGYDQQDEAVDLDDELGTPPINSLDVLGWAHETVAVKFTEFDRGCGEWSIGVGESSAGGQELGGGRQVFGPGGGSGR